MATRRVVNPLRIHCRSINLGINTARQSAAVRHGYTPTAFHLRTYATRPKKPEDATTWGPVNISIVKGEHLEEYQKKNPSLLRYSIGQYLEILEVFANISEKSGPDWPMRIKKEDRPPKEMLNDMGVFLSEEASSPRGGRQHGLIGFAFFSGASSLGCETSCISVISTLLTSKSGTAAFSWPLYKPTFARFRGIVSSVKNPYAMAVDAEIHRRAGRNNAAIRCLERALELGGPDFQWIPTCEYRLGVAYKELNDFTKAQPLIERAAAAGVPQAWFHLAYMSPVGSQVRMQAGYKAGCFGQPMAFADLADELDFRAGKDGLTPEEREDLLHFSAEAKRLARHDVPY